MRLLFVFFVLICFSINHANAINFKNFYELSECVDYYNTFKQYKQNLTNCLKNQNIIIEENNLKVLNNKSGIIENIIDLDLPKEKIVKKKRKKKLSDILKEVFSDENIDKIAEEENIFNKPSALSDDYNKKFSLNEKNFKELNNYIKKNPQDIYAITEDINILTYKNQYLSEFKRNEILLNVYNSFDPTLLIPSAGIANVSAAAGTSGVAAAAAIAGLAAAGGGGGGGSSSPATISFSVSSTAIGECDNAITITGSLTKAHSSNVTITYSTSGTATDSTDYNLSSTTSTIVAGSTSGSITLTPVNDTTKETSETVIISTSVSGVSTTGNTSTTITIYDYVLKCNSTAFSEGTTSEQNTIKGRSSWTTVDQSSNTVHPYELFNLHKAHSFKSGSTTLTGNGQTIYIMDDAMHNNHASFQGKTVTMLDSPSVSNSSYQHGTHVASIAAGIVAGTTHGVAPDADIVFSTFSGDNGTAQATDIDTARTSHSAIAMNNSWGYSDGWNGSAYTSAVTWTELESSASSNGRNIRQELDNSSMHAFGAHTSTYLTALDNFQNSGVIVWASSNYSGDSDVSIMAALPAYFNGVDDSVDLSDAWLSVMYAEFTGSSLSGASTSDFTRRGNPCGAAKEWCLVVDDTQIGAAGYVNSGGTSIYSTLSGSSMGAPQVSGMIALLAQAFPNHTPEQLTDRLLASANNSWFTSSGNTTFTTHGASVKHGYNDTWGHGVPDMYAALSPITTNSNPFSLGSGGGGGGGGSGSSGGGSIPFSKLNKHPVSSTSFSSSNSLGDAISNGLQDKTVYAYDALHGGFKLNVSDFISYKDLEEQKIEVSLVEELNHLRNFNDKEDANIKEIDLKNFSGEFINLRDKYNKGLSFTLDQPNIALQNFHLYNNDHYKNPFISENKGVGFNNKFYFLGNDVLIGYNNSKFNPLTNINKDLIIPLETLAMSINIDNDNLDLLSFTTGIMKEENTFLLSKTEGAFKMDNDGNISNFYGLNLSKSLNNFGNLNISTMIGNSKTSSNINSIIVDSSNVISSSFEINYELKNIFKKDQLDISFSQPNKVEHGDMTFRLMGLADKNGILPYTDYKINLKPSGRQKDLTISYYKNHTNNFRTGFKTIITDDMGHVKNSNLVSNFMLTTSLTF